MTTETQHVHDENCNHNHDHETVDHPFEKGLALYEAKADYNEVIPLFEEGITLTPKDSVGYTCLAWLLLLRNEGDDAQRAEKICMQGLRLDPGNYQAHFNLALAMLHNKTKGVRQEFQQAMRKLQTQEDKEEVLTNLREAVSREPEFEAAAKMLNWIENP